MLEITTAATDRSLLSMAELRAAVEVTGRNEDANLKALGLQVAATIAGVCKLTSSGGHIPTLRKETLTETFRLGHPGRFGFRQLGRHHMTARERIALSRRPILAMQSITEAGTALTSDDYEVDSAAGIITRLCGDFPTQWRPGKIVFVYDAGWDTVPDDLKLAAIKTVQGIWKTELRDPLLRSKTIPGVIEKQYWNPNVTGVVAKALSDDVISALRPYMNFTV